MISNPITEVYILKDENDLWLGQTIFTDNGMFSTVSKWGNYSYIWNNFK